MRLKSESKANSRMASQAASRAASVRGSQVELVPSTEATMLETAGRVDVGDLEKGLRGPVGTEGFPVVAAGVGEKLGMVEQLKDGTRRDSAEEDVGEMRR